VNDVIEAEFTWEGGGSAGIHSFNCKCGKRVGTTHEHWGDMVMTASCEDTVSCPHCGRIYQAKWVGMILEEVTKEPVAPA